jgi:hypothetical protein
MTSTIKQGSIMTKAGNTDRNTDDFPKYSASTCKPNQSTDKN